MTHLSVVSVVFCCAVVILLPRSVSNCDNDVCVGDSQPSEPQMVQSVVTKSSVLHTISNAFLRSKRTRMAWRSSGDSNTELIENLQRNEIFSDERVKQAMLNVDRADFAPSFPYVDRPVGIGYEATISAPHMHATSLELLKDHLKEGDRALDVGSGSGYLTVCMALMVGAKGKVVGVEHIGELVNDSIVNVKKHHDDLLTSGRVLLVEGDGREGYAPEAPYNAIHVGAAAPSIPFKLVEQLAKGGRMLIPVGKKDAHQEFIQVDKLEDGQVKTTSLMGVIYVPLTDKTSQVPN